MCDFVKDSNKALVGLEVIFIQGRKMGGKSGGLFRQNFSLSLIFFLYRIYLTLLLLSTFSFSPITLALFYKLVSLLWMVSYLLNFFSVLLLCN